MAAPQRALRGSSVPVLTPAAFTITEEQLSAPVAAAPAPGNQGCCVLVIGLRLVNSLKNHEKKKRTFNNFNKAPS